MVCFFALERIQRFIAMIAHFYQIYSTQLVHLLHTQTLTHPNDTSYFLVHPSAFASKGAEPYVYDYVYAICSNRKRLFIIATSSYFPFIFILYRSCLLFIISCFQFNIYFVFVAAVLAYKENKICHCAIITIRVCVCVCGFWVVWIAVLYVKLYIFPAPFCNKQWNKIYLWRRKKVASQ